MVETVNVTSREVLEDLGSALTFVGVDLQYLDNIFSWIRNYTEVKKERVYITLGSVMNNLYGLTGNNAYPDDLHIVSIDLNDIESPNNLVLPRFSVGGRWLDDVISNNLDHQSELN